jgi:enoyl-CoA hydratase/carnithine racemase
MADIAVDRRGAVMQLTLNRPQKKNALTGAMYAALAAALQDAEEHRDVRAILLRGAGDTFTAGNDLGDFLNDPPAGPDSPVFRFMSALGGAQKPVVAGVQGAAVGIGTTLLLHCDLVFAAEGTRFHLPFVDLGLVPEFGSSALVPALAGYRRAAEYLLLCRPFDAIAARDIGLVNDVVASDRLEAHARSAAEALAEKPPAAVRLTKNLMKLSTAGLVEAAIDAESRLFADRLRSIEAREAFAAFLEKRRPDFSKLE